MVVVVVEDVVVQVLLVVVEVLVAVGAAVCMHVHIVHIPVSFCIINLFQTKLKSKTSRRAV